MKKTITATRVERLYLSYVNDFITVQAFATYYGLTHKEADQIIARGRANHGHQTADIKNQ